MGVTLTKFGDWAKAGIVLKGIQAKLKPHFEAQLKESGELILKTLREHIELQDLDWTPLSESTVKQKGNETIYVETGFLRDNLSVRKVKSSKKDYTLFIGASPYVKNSKGVKLSDIMIWLEYGTAKIPPRPLIRPTWKELEPQIKTALEDSLNDLFVKAGG